MTKTLHLQFTEDEAARLERVAKMRNENKISVLAKRVLMDYVGRSELMQRGHFPQRPHPSEFRRKEGKRG